MVGTGCPPYVSQLNRPSSEPSPSKKPWPPSRLPLSTLLSNRLSDPPPPSAWSTSPRPAWSASELLDWSLNRLLDGSSLFSRRLPPCSWWPNMFSSPWNRKPPAATPAAVAAIEPSVLPKPPRRKPDDGALWYCGWYCG